MKRSHIQLFKRASLLFLLSLGTACGPMTIGRPFSVNPEVSIKVGHDQKKDVLKKMGQPFRRNKDAEGREIYTYVWADGKGGGQKCIIVFNKAQTVAIVEVVP